MHDGLGLYVLLLFLSYFLIFNDLKIHWNDLCRMFRVGSTATVDNQSEISFSITSSRDVAMAVATSFCLLPSQAGWLGSRVVSVLDSGAEGPGFTSLSGKS